MKDNMSSALLRSLVFVLSLVILLQNSSAVDIYSTPQEFCYTDPECGPDSDKWTGMCHNSTRQSPLNLWMSNDEIPEYGIMPLKHLKADHFFLQNNGHTINVDFTDSGTASYIFPGYGVTYIRYKFANAHFHWGVNNDVGSEHTVHGRSYSMEMHLVHYNEKYKTMKKAVESGDRNALAVVAIFFNASDKFRPHPALQPIVKNLQDVQDSSKYWMKIEEPLDMTTLIPKSNARMFNYRGSLTTPTCNEQVNWFVFDRPAVIASSDVEAFRKVNDGNGKPLMENHRPVQPQNERTIHLYKLY